LSAAAGLIATGLQLSSGCVADADGVRVRDFGGDGVVVDEGADLTLEASKVYGNGGDGLVLSGATSISSSEIAFNGDDGVLVNSSASSTFVGLDVRDNGRSCSRARTPPFLRHA
jgi:parallel beta helix pectate lyase-like protein